MPDQITTAVILAAGRGVRLGPRGKLTPKGFLTLGELPIVEESVLQLLNHGITRVVIVTGHLAEFYERMEKQYSPHVETVFNPRFASSGSMYSLCCALPHVDEDFLLLESDLIYESRALSTCLESPFSSLILLSGTTNAGDEIYVELAAGMLKNMSKDPFDLEERSSGEFVGVLKISQRLLEALHEEAARQFQVTYHVEYETQCLVAVSQAHPIPCTVVPDLVWCEIDHQQQLNNALHEIYPALKRGLVGYCHDVASH